MSAYPPAPPTVPAPAPARPPQPDTLWFRPYTFGYAFSLGWSAFKRRYGTLLLGALIYCGFYAFALGLSFVDRSIFGADAWIEPLGTLFGWLVLGPVMVGITYLGAAAARGEPASASDAFIAFRRYPTVLGITLLTTLIMLGVGVVALVPAAAVGATGGGSGAGNTALLLVLLPIFLVLLVAAVYLSVRLWFASLVAVDPRAPEPGAIDAIKLSWDMTRGITALSLLGLGIVLMVIFFASLVLAILPAIFFGLPLMTAVGGAAYATLAAQRGITPIEGVCPGCGYPDGGGDTCPECGHSYNPLGGGGGALLT